MPLKPRNSAEDIITKLEEKKIRELLDKAQQPAPQKR